MGNSVVKNGKNCQAIILVLIILFTISSEAYSMSLFDLGKICLFSETRGQVVIEGKPVEGVTVIRKVLWQNKTSSETVSTDKDGNFHFNARFTNSFTKFMPVEAVITQNIILQYQGQDYEGWKTNKRDYEENSELNGKPIQLICDLKNKSVVNEEGSQVIKGICRWK